MNLDCHDPNYEFCFNLKVNPCVTVTKLQIFIQLNPDLPRVLGKGNIRGKSGFAVNRSFACLKYAY